MTGIEKLLDAAKQWAKYFDDLDRISDPSDILAKARKVFHGDRMLATTEAIAAYQAEQTERELLVDGAWLSGLGAAQEDHPSKWLFDRRDALPIGLWIVDDGWKAMLVISVSCQSCIVRGLKTRGEVLDLCKTLGVKHSN